MTKDQQAMVEQWRCFHCGDTMTSRQEAVQHFGRYDGATPACILKGAEGGLLKALRDAEEQADEAIQMMHSESTDAAKAYHRQRSRHTQALMAAEEAGYEKGLSDGRALIARYEEALGKAHGLLMTIEQRSHDNCWWVNATDPETAVCDTLSAVEAALNPEKQG